MFEKKEPPRYTYIRRDKPFPFGFYLTESSIHCSLCELLKRPESNHCYDSCPACLKEMQEYAKKQSLQDFLFGGVPQEHRGGYTIRVHAKVRLMELFAGAGFLSRDEAYSIIADIGKSLQYPYWAQLQKQQPPTEEMKTATEYKLF